jgi:bifunctional UDP-N-acetylglucosamine pyrophosphorylase/glucosamine-1-phosphate N-acetyltransferase
MPADPKNRPLAALVLAAGKGTRLASSRPKVLHEVCGRPLLGYSIAAAETLRPERLLVVVGPEADEVRHRFADRVEFAVQAEPRGTGHAVGSCRQALEGFRGDVLVLYGDTPLLRGETLARMRQTRREQGADLVLLTAPVDVPGIVLRDERGRVARIVEATDATPEQQAIRERNTGVYLLDAELCWKLLARVGNDNAQGEVYLTDIVELAVRDGLRVEAVALPGSEEALGVNTRAELVRAMELMRRRIAIHWIDRGVTLVDPAATYIDADVEIGSDTRIDPGCMIQGTTRIGARVHLKAHCTIESSQIGDDVEMGPCAHLRPGCEIGAGSRIGNFVEVKNSVLGRGVKADHLSYIGDADVGDRASFGCGSVVVNYDGEKKHRTRIGARAFIGCNANLVAPLEIEPDSYVAAGSTITTRVPEGALAVARARQRNIEGWVDRRGKRRE